jgi:hypothetical protein
MRRTRLAAAIVLVACGMLAVAITSAGSPAPASAAASAPSTTTSSPADVGQSSATLNGTVNPNGQSTTYYFQYGTTTSYGTQTSPADVGSGTTPVAVHQAIFGLSQNTTYHYRLVATNATGTTNGADGTFTTPTTTPSQVVVLGHEGFVSPGWIVGAEVGCFHGTTTCTGHLTMTHDGNTIAQRDYSIPADSGGFQNVQLTSTGRTELGSNSTFHLLAVTVTATPSSGQPVSFVIHLARWVWH